MLLRLEVLSFEIVVTETILKEQTAFCQRVQKIRYFHTPVNRKTQLFSLCVCAVITAGICCLPLTFNHHVASQTAN